MGPQQCPESDTYKFVPRIEARKLRKRVPSGTLFFSVSRSLSAIQPGARLCRSPCGTERILHAFSQELDSTLRLLLWVKSIFCRFGDRERLQKWRAPRPVSVQRIFVGILQNQSTHAVGYDFGCSVCRGGDDRQGAGHGFGGGPRKRVFERRANIHISSAVIPSHVRAGGAELY
jgi:hypothetical protein